MAKPSRTKPLGRPARAGNYDAREHLLDVATRLFAERGVANTTLAKIATTAGVTSAMVHYWFQNRDRLLDAVVEERIAGAFHAVWDPVNPADDTPGTQTEGIVHRMFAVTEKMPWLPSLWLREIVNEGGLLRERALKRIPVNKVRDFSQCIARGVDRGKLNSQIDPVLMFNSILALVMLPQATAKIWQRLHLSGSFDRTNLKRHVIALLLYGLRGNLTQASSVTRARDVPQAVLRSRGRALR
jgi:AcrR family transcriptional regulator